MLKVLKSKLAVGLIVIAGLSGYAVLHSRDGSRPAPGSKEQETADLKQLEKGDGNWAEQSQALMRLSIQQRPEALSFIKTKLQAKDENLAPWATRALGYFTTPEAIELIRTQLRSETASIREAAIDALGMRSHPEKLKLMEEAKTLVKGDGERARLQMASIRTTPNAEAKSNLAKAVIAELRRKDLDINARNYLVSQIFFQSPRTREVEAYFNSLSSNIKEADEISAIATVRALKIYCPGNRFALFKEALGRSNLSVPGQSQILNELIFHAGPEAMGIFQAASSSGKLNAAFLDNLRKQLENPKMKSPCAAPQSVPATATKHS